MPRDDLSIDFVRPFAGHLQEFNMPINDHMDVATVLEEWVNRVTNLPAEIAHMQEEIEEKDRQMNVCLQIITKHDMQIQKWIRANGSHVPYPKEEAYIAIIRDNYDAAKRLQDEKVALAKKTMQVMDKHTKWVDGHIKGLQDRNEFPKDPDLPSMLRPQGQAPERSQVANIDPSVAAMPTVQRQVQNPLPPTRHANQYPIKTTQQVQAEQRARAAMQTGAASTAAALALQARGRDPSPAHKRPRLSGPSTLQVSGLRQGSTGPGTPRSGTPTANRAGSAQPRVSHKITKKVAPQGSRQSGAPRKPSKKSTLSGVGRVKRTGNKNSPSSNADSELSDDDTGSQDGSEGASQVHRDGDEDMIDIDDEEGGDDKKYCTCQSVSFGDMVACDNDACPYEWFHWGCVGLKSEPIGTWICPVCTKTGFGQGK